MTKNEIIKELKELIIKLANESTLLPKNVFLNYLADESTSPDEYLYIESKEDNGVESFSVKWLREHLTFNPNHPNDWVKIHTYNKRWRAWTGASIGDAPWDDD